MNAVIYFSCSGQSLAVAKIVADKLSYPLLDYRDVDEEFDFAVIVFPVHCQSVPKPLKKFLKDFKANFVALIATYGRESFGNTLFDAGKLCKNIFAAMYLPAKHTYCDGNFETPEIPDEFYKKFEKPNFINIPKERHTPFAKFLPSLRSRLILKIKKTDNCISCNLCGENCPTGAIKCGKIDCKCIRCLKCVYTCPNGGLIVQKSLILKTYLKKARREKVILYI